MHETKSTHLERVNDTPRINFTLDPRFYLDDRDKLHVRLVDEKAPGWKILNWLPTMFGNWLGLRQAREIVSEVRHDRRDMGFFRKVVDAMKLRVSYSEERLQQVPKTGPLVVVANHPLHGVDGMAVAHMISQVRSDVKIMLTSSFDGIPGVAEHGIFVSEGNGSSARSRSESTREAMKWLKDGHVLIVFPAGQGSFLKSAEHTNPVDGTWQKGVSLLIRKSQANVLPVFVEGCPGKLFRTVRSLSRTASMFLLVREIVRQRESKVTLKVGTPISGDEFLAQGDAETQMQFLRDRTYALARKQNAGLNCLYQTAARKIFRIHKKQTAIPHESTGRITDRSVVGSGKNG